MAVVARLERAIQYPAAVAVDAMDRSLIHL